MCSVAKFFVIILSAALAVDSAWASPFTSCSGTEKPPTPTTLQLYSFALALKAQFDLNFNLSDGEIQKNIDCLTKDFEDPSCQTRIQYFQETLPHELQRYRRNRALSTWDTQMRISNRVGTAAFNYSMEKPHPYWLEFVSPKPLMDDELTAAKVEFEKESALILKKTIKKEASVVHPQTLLLPDNNLTQLEGLSLLRNGDWGRLYSSSNVWAARAVAQMEKLMFRTNRRRMIQQLSSHPILAFLDDSNVTPTGIISALGAMRGNLTSERAKVEGLFSKILKTDNWGESDFYSMVDYFLVTDSLLAQQPIYCDTATAIFNSDQNRQFWTSLVVGGALVGLFVFAPIIMGSLSASGVVGAVAVKAFSITMAAGMVSLQAYSLIDANEKRQVLMRSAFTNPDSSLELKSVDDAYLQSDNLETEVLLTPLAVTGIPMLKFGRILSMLR